MAYRQINCKQSKECFNLSIGLLYCKKRIKCVPACKRSIFRQNNIAEEVAWIVGDEPIYKSQIEEQYSQLQYEKTPINGDPYCVIPEQLAIDKLFLHQAVIDTVTVEDATVAKEVNARINYFVESLGSKEKVEEYFRKSIPEIREQYMEIMKNQYIVQQVKENLTKNVKSTPADVRKYYESLDKDSIPYVPMQVEAQIITIKPIIPQEITSPRLCPARKQRRIGIFDTCHPLLARRLIGARRRNRIPRTHRADALICQRSVQPY